MLTETEIANIETFDLKALEEGLRQVELSLSDSLATKNSLDKKTTSLLTIFISFATIAVGFSNSSLFHSPSYSFSLGFYCLSFFFWLATAFLLKSLWCNDYGSLGRFPDTFLKKEYVEGVNTYYGYTLAVILRQYAERINKSDKLNEKRAWWINAAILSGIAAPLLSALIIIFW